jgi:hypothetical protein
MLAMIAREKTVGMMERRIMMTFWGNPLVLELLKAEVELGRGEGSSKMGEAVYVAESTLLRMVVGGGKVSCLTKDMTGCGMSNAGTNMLYSGEKHKCRFETCN